MSDAFWMAFFACIASVVASVLSWWNRRTLQEVKHATNSMKDELVKVTEKEAHARGVQDERERQNHGNA